MIKSKHFQLQEHEKITDDEQKNQQLSKELLHDEKELAEHTMLVDLGRNDIGRVCKYGSVHVEELMEIKRFSHVQHIVTHVVGSIDEKNDMFDAFQEVFPAGTVSGAPKVRAMEIIDELEPESRGPYAGAVGYFSYNGCCDFAIAIRSIFIENNKGFVQSGAGIVSDSIPENEFKETQHKAGAYATSSQGGIKLKFLIIDNYDSFVYNIAQYLGELDVDCDVIRNDKITLHDIQQKNYDAIIISPGPGTPEDKKILWSMF